MRNTRFWLSLAAVILSAGLLAHGEEKNGLLVTVGKVTLDRADQRPGYYYSTRIDRTEALKVTIKNTGFKPLAEGEVQWEILVRKHDSTIVESTSGKEKLQALRSSDTAEVVIGGAQVQGWRDASYNAKDKVEWQVTVLIDGKEMIKTNSTSGFDAIAKRAIKVTPPKK